MIDNKAAKVYFGMLVTFLRWTAWFVSIFILSHIVLLIIFANVDGSMEWTVLETSVQASRIYLLVLGIMTTIGFLPYFIENGVTRKDYFFGMAGAFVTMSVILTIIIGIMIGLERVIFSFMGWNQLFGDSVAASSGGGLAAMFAMTFFQLIIFYLIGWFISTGFYRFHWLIGLGFIALGIVMIAMFNYVWGIEDHIPWLSWIPVGEQTTFTAVFLTIIMASILTTIMRLLTKNAAVKA
ncbi:hypothetical protein [Alteribacillus sp. HJP-4]|uniref:hypothetical protein n=1 Tax=Alteribacillus sp. HJP-4 TaxID=2775394 RepID=UPI0035CCD63C